MIVFRGVTPFWQRWPKAVNEMLLVLAKTKELPSCAVNHLLLFTGPRRGCGQRHHRCLPARGAGPGDTCAGRGNLVLRRIQRKALATGGYEDACLCRGPWSRALGRFKLALDHSVPFSCALGASLSALLPYGCRAFVDLLTQGPKH